MFEIDESAIEATLLRLVAARGEGKTICPSEVARALGGADGAWRRQMQPVRSVASRLAAEGRVTILRKRKPVADPAIMTGIYRIGPARETGD